MSPLTSAPVSEHSAGQKDWATPFLQGQREAVREHYDRLAEQREKWFSQNAYYYGKVTEFLRFAVEPNRRVLQVGCQTGFLLEAMQPSYGVGIDVSSRMVEVASKLRPAFRFERQDPEQLCLQEIFDYVLVSGVHNIVDVQAAFLKLRELCRPHSRVLVFGYSYLWQPLIKFAEKVGWKVPEPVPNWLSAEDIQNLLALSGFETVKTYGLFLLPVGIPGLSFLLNRVLARLPFFRRLCFLYVVIARPQVKEAVSDATVSVIVPCKNESDNIEAAVQRIPEMGAGTEIIFCDDRSTDGTAEEVRRCQVAYPQRRIKLVEGPGICKALNVWKGFNAAEGEILMILDADLTTIPEELPYFYRALIEGCGEFINGSRMVYPMEEQAMRGLNILGNTFFGWAFTFLLGQRIKDTLCGTKALWRRDYERLARFHGTWGVTDRWGDYELLFGAARLHLKIVDLPVHYMERRYGETKMTKRFRNAWIMLRMCRSALVKLKFI